MTSQMSPRTAARTAGLLFITATVAGVLSTTLLAPDGTAPSPADVLAQRDRWTSGALLILIMAAAVAMIPPVLFPVLRRHGEGLAVGYVVARTLEVVFLLPAAVAPLLLLIVSSEGTGPPQFQLARSLTTAYQGWVHPISAAFFCLSVVLLNYILLRSGLVPRVIAAWGLISAAPYLVDGLLVMFDRLAVGSSLHTLLVLPLALNEMALAGWLLFKGLRTGSGSVRADSTDQVPQKA